MPTRHDLELFLKQSEIFQHLPLKDRQRMIAFSHERSFTKGQLIFREGQPSDSVWLVLEGRVHLLHYLTQGRAQTSCVFKEGETFCCLPALDRGAYPATAQAAVSSRVLQIPTWLFHELMGKSPSFMRETFCIFGERLRQVEAKTCLIHDPVEKRVAATLLSLQRKFGKIIPLTRQEVAELAGTTVETTIRTISRFKKEGWIRSTRGKIELLNPQRLGDLSG